MKEQIVGRRTVVVAMLATLLIWILSLGSGAVASPYRANQTIPTFTPTGQVPPTQPPATPEPTRPQATPAETEPPPGGPGTPTATPSATLPPGGDTPGAPATAVPGATEPVAPSPTAAGATPAPTQPGAATAQPSEPTGGATAEPLAVSPTPTMVEGEGQGDLFPPLPGGDQGGEATPAGGRPASAASVLLSAPCIWLSLGLILMAAGSAVLIGQRRRR